MPLIPQESYRPIFESGEHPRAVAILQRRLRDQAETMREAKGRGIRVHEFKGGYTVLASANVAVDESDADAYDKAVEERRKTGHIDELELRIKDNGTPTFALVSGWLDPVLSDEEAGAGYTADEWFASLQFPSPKEGQTQRAVLDLWRLPRTELTRISKQFTADGTDAEARQRYDVLERSLRIVRGDSLVPPGAVDHEHIVYGDEGYLHPYDDQRLVQITTLIEQGGNEALAFRLAQTYQS